MNNHFLIAYQKRYFLRIFLLTAVIIAAVILSFWAIDMAANGIIVRFIGHFSSSLAVFIIDNKLAILFFALLLSLIITWSAVQLKSSKELGILLSSIEQVFQKEEGLISLPENFKEIETQLNSIKYENIHNEQLAKEAEQRKNDLVVYLAHDLKTPLTSIIGYLTLVKDEEMLPKELKQKYLSISLDKAYRLEELINEFFEITRYNLQNTSLQKEALDISTLLYQLKEEFYPALAEKNLQCEMDSDKTLSYYGDPNKLARMFDNLLRNAITYGNEGSAIHISAHQTEEGISVEFVNEGVAITPEQCRRIFEKFYRLDEARQSKTGGTGLGLAIALEIARLHGGDIQADSQEGITRFTVFLGSTEESLPL